MTEEEFNRRTDELQEELLLFLHERLGVLDELDAFLIIARLMESGAEAARKMIERLRQERGN